MALQTGEYQGFLKDLLDQLSEDLEFDYVINEDLIHGFPSTDGNWTGLIGSLVDRVILKHFFNVEPRVVYDRVRKRKNYFEIPAFLQIERGISRTGNSNSKSNENKNVFVYVFI